MDPRVNPDGTTSPEVPNPIHTRDQGNETLCRVFSSSLGDLGLKWFEKIPLGSIGGFVQLSEPFVDRFVINTNETLSYCSKMYCELYNEIDGYSEELAVVGLRSERSFGMICRQNQQPNCMI